MPIQINYTDPASGLNVPAMYCYADNVQFDNVNLIVRYTISGYLNAAAKTAKKQPVITRPPVVITDQALGLTAAMTLNDAALAIYNAALSTDPFFTGGTIVA